MIEYGQRKELGLLEKTKVTLACKDKHVELYLTKPSFLVIDNKVKKIGEKIEESSTNELNRVLAEYKGTRTKLDRHTMDLLKAELGEFDITF